MNKDPRLFVMALFFLLSPSAFAQDDGLDTFDAAFKARQAHEKASSDMIYQNEEWKAIYYQNQQIIQLLQDIRDRLDAMKAGDGMKNTEEKKT